MQDNGGTTPTVARRRAPPLHRQSSGPMAEFARASRQERILFELSREPMTFPVGRDRRHDADSAVQRGHESGAGGLAARTAGGKRLRASPPMSRALWGGARRSASLPPRGIDDSAGPTGLFDDVANATSREIGAAALRASDLLPRQPFDAHDRVGTPPGERNEPTSGFRCRRLFPFLVRGNSCSRCERSDQARAVALVIERTRKCSAHKGEAPGPPPPG
jgi:hypothetical protein